MTRDEISNWQNFLIGQNPGVSLIATGMFDAATLVATRSFQSMHRLVADGIVGPKTLAVARSLGFDDNKQNQQFPNAPSFKPLDFLQKQKLFGSFSYRPDPQPGNREHIAITDGWASRNITAVNIPELAKIKYTGPNGLIWAHKLAAPKIKDLFRLWRERGLIDRVLTFDGCWNPRFIRGSNVILSNHCLGTAIDINAIFNPLGAAPKKIGEKGCILELVPTAIELGFYPGLFFSNRIDAMHFEIAIL